MAWKTSIGLFAVALWAAGCGGGTEGSDGGHGNVDSGPGNPDGGPGGIDGGPAVDGGPGSLDGGPGGTDGGPPGVDAGPSGVDGGVDGGPANLDPRCTITAPIDGTAQAYDADFTFVADASDPEDGALSGASVVWRSNLVTAPLGSGSSITVRLDPGTHTITCTATDSAGNTGTDSIMVTSQSPVARIFHPGDGETRSATAPVPFVGAARDLEDGALSGASLVWTSSRDGMIGTGTSFSATLSPGTNVITLTATDSDGNTGTDTITLTITP